MLNAPPHSDTAGVAEEANAVRCRSCGWLLADTSAQAKCPNCDASAISSNQSDLLRYSTPSFLLSLIVGARLVFCAEILFWADFADTALAYVFRDLPLMPEPFYWAQECSMILGWWLLTRAEPSGLGENSYAFWRKAVRILATIRFAFFLAPELLNLHGSPTPLAPLLNVILAVRAIPSLWPASFALGVTFDLIYIERLMLRIPDVRLTKGARFYRILLQCLFGFQAVCTHLMWIGQPDSPVTPHMALMVREVAEVGVLPFLFGYLAFIWHLGSQLGVQRRAAKDVWPAHQ
jgi:hypothetical protein